MVAILEEIMSMVSSITDEDVRRCERQLGPAQTGETELGSVHNVEAHKLWATAHAFDARASQALHHAKFTASTEMEMAVYAEQAERFEELEKVSRALFWAQIKDDIGGKAWTASHIGLRSGWMITKNEHKAQNVLSKLFGASFPLPEGPEE